jgi:hypothetical protein
MLLTSVSKFSDFLRLGVGGAAVVIERHSTRFLALLTEAYNKTSSVT